VGFVVDIMTLKQAFHRVVHRSALPVRAITPLLRAHL
jgi:hypothetical protein